MSSGANTERKAKVCMEWNDGEVSPSGRGDVGIGSWSKGVLSLSITHVTTCAFYVPSFPLYYRVAQGNKAMRKNKGGQRESFYIKGSRRCATTKEWLTVRVRSGPSGVAPVRTELLS